MHYVHALVWRSTADNIIKTYFHGQSTKFLWRNTNFNGQKLHVSVLSTCFHCQNTLRFGKHIFMGKVQHFYWQSMKFLWTNRYHPPRWRCSELLATPEVGGARKERCSCALVTNYSSFFYVFSPQQI